MRRPEGFDGPPRRPASPRPDPAQQPDGDPQDPALDASRPSANAVAAAAELDAATVVPASGRRRTESNASRTDRLLREAERRQARIDAADARRAAGEARAAAKARRRTERSEVRRFTAASRRRLRTSLGVVVALVGSLALLVGLVHSPLMVVREIQVVGAARVDPVAVQASLSGHLGEPIATVSDASVRDELAGFTGLQSFVVDVVPPSTIIVRVVERQPIVVATVDGEPRMLDAAGVVLGPPTDEALPALEGVEVGSAPFEAVSAALVAMPPTLRAQVATVTATTIDDVTMSLASGQQVVWGGAADASLKADVLAALVAAADPAVPVTFDVSAPEHPVVRP